MEKIEIRSRILCDNYWSGFLPLDNSDWIKYELINKNKSYNIAIGVESLEEDTQSLNRPYTIKQIERKIFQGKFLTIIVKFDIDKENLYAMEIQEEPFSPHKQNPSSHETLIIQIYNEVKEVLSETVDYLIDNLRNQFKQYWIKQSIVFENEFLDRLSWRKMDKEEWNHFLNLNIKTSIKSLENNIGELEWNKLGNRLKERNKSDFTYFLLSRAKKEFVSKNLRMSVIECIIALEHILGSYASKLLSSQFEINKDATNSIFEKLGLRKSASLIFEHIPEFTILDKDHKKALLRGVEIRNTIIHQRSRKIKESEARDLLTGLEELIKIAFERT